MKLVKIVFFVMLLSLCCGLASATDYYVSPTGSNAAAGDIDHPWADPTYAATQAVAGDTIYLRDGTWDNYNIDFPNNGTSENPITMKNYTGEYPKLNGTTVGNDTSDMGINIENREWIIIDGIEAYQYFHPINIEKSRNISVYNSSFHDGIQGVAVAIGALGWDILIENCEVYNSGWNGIQIAGNREPPYGDGACVENITVRNCNLHDNNAHNQIDLFGNTKHITIENNTIRDSIYSGIYSHSITDKHYYITIKNNIISNNSVGINLENAHDSVFSNNTVTITSSNGILATQNSDNITVQDCIVSTLTASEAISMGPTNMTYIRNYLNGTSKKYRTNNVGPGITQDAVGSTYQCSFILGSELWVRYSNGRVFTSTTPSVATYDAVIPVTFTPTGSVRYIDGDSAYSQAIDIVAYNYSAMPTTENATVTPATLQGIELVRFTANSTNGNLINFTAWGLSPGTQYRVEQDAVSYSVQTANESGYIMWNNSVWSSHIYTVEPTGVITPEANFTGNLTICGEGQSIQFNDSSENTPTSWSWDFDGDSVEDSAAQNPTYSYSTAGTYNVSLTVTNDAGSDTETKLAYVTVLSPPEANFTASPVSGAATMFVIFTDTSVYDPTAWHWDFGDGSISTEQNPVHTYSTAGNYTVNLTVSNEIGTDSDIKNDYIVVSEATFAPVAAFTANDTAGTAPLDIAFTDNSTNTPTTWLWNFGDGTTSTDQNHVHTYSADGSYTVTLTVSNAAGSNTLIKSSYITVGTTSSTSLNYVMWWLRTHFAWWALEFPLLGEV